MICRSIIFTNSPLLKAYKYGELFQLVPFFYLSDAPFSKYASHFPAIIEYQVEDVEEDIACEEEFRKKGLSEDILRLCRKIPHETRIRKEILHLLSSVTNFHFFEYNSQYNCWGIQLPMKDVSELSEEELNYFETQTSHWIIKGYRYPNIGKDLNVTDFTTCPNYYEPTDNPIKYFTNNPHLAENPEIKFPFGLEYVLDRYYSMDLDDRYIVAQCIGLLYDGIELFDTKRSVSLLSIVSSIEGMAKLDHNKYGKVKNLGPTARFLRYLKFYVAGRSEEKFREFYQKRCDISHDGTLFLSDFDLYGDLKIQDEDWFHRLEILQMARLALYNWLRRKL